jgi:hypothetical protein
MAPDPPSQTERDAPSRESDPAGQRPPGELCARCRYSLEGLPADAPCPECGSRKRRTGNAEDASTPSIVSLVLGIIAAACLFLGPAAVLTLLLGPAAVGLGAIALWTGRRTLRTDGATAIIGIALGGLSFLILIAVLAFALFLTTP